MEGMWKRTENGYPGKNLSSRNRFGSGGQIRTDDLRVMSPTSYLTAPPRVMGHLRVQGAVYMRPIPGGQGANSKLFNPDRAS